MKSKPVNPEKGNGLNGKRKLDYSKNLPLKGKTVYLDLKGYRGCKKLEEDLLQLGGIVEKFLSKDINYLITNRGTPGDYNKDNVEETRRQSTSPGLSTPSPFNLSAGRSGVDSPGTVSDQTNTVFSRGKSMAQKANQTKTYGSMDVIKAAQTWGSRIIHITVAEKWVKKEKERLPLQTKNEKAKPKGQSKAKRLNSPYVKIEQANKRYKPLYQEFAVVSKINLQSPQGTCPFNQGAKGQNAGRVKEDDRAEGDMREEREGEEERQTLSQETPPVKRQSPRKRKPQAAGTSFEETPILTIGEVRRLRQIRKQAEQRMGYCECCQTKYEDLDKHLKGDVHRGFVRNKRNYTQIDLLIDQGPNMERFLADVQAYHREHMEESRKIRNQELEKAKKTARQLSRKSGVLKRNDVSSNCVSPCKVAPTKSENSQKKPAFTLSKSSPELKATATRKTPTKSTEKNNSRQSSTEPKPATPRTGGIAKNIQKDKSVSKPVTPVSVSAVSKTPGGSRNGTPKSTKNRSSQSGMEQLGPNFSYNQTPLRSSYISALTKISESKFKVDDKEKNSSKGDTPKSKIKVVDKDGTSKGATPKSKVKANYKDHGTSKTETPKSKNRDPYKGKGILKGETPRKKVKVHDKGKGLSKEDTPRKTRKSIVGVNDQIMKSTDSKNRDHTTIAEKNVTKNQTKTNINKSSSDHFMRFDSDLCKDVVISLGRCSPRTMREQRLVEGTVSPKKVVNSSPSAVKKLGHDNKFLKFPDCNDKESNNDRSKSNSNGDIVNEEVPVSSSTNLQRRNSSVGSMKENRMPQSPHTQQMDESNLKKIDKENSKKIVKLRRRWSVLTDRSMKKLLSNESESPPFEGFSQSSINASSLPRDMSYLDLSELEVPENSQYEWVFHDGGDERSEVSEDIRAHLDLNCAMHSDASSDWCQKLDNYIESSCMKRKSEMSKSTSTMLSCWNRQQGIEGKDGRSHSPGKKSKKQLSSDFAHKNSEIHMHKGEAGVLEAGLSRHIDVYESCSPLRRSSRLNSIVPSPNHKEGLPATVTCSDDPNSRKLERSLESPIPSTRNSLKRSAEEMASEIATKRAKQDKAPTHFTWNFDSLPKEGVVKIDEEISLNMSSPQKNSMSSPRGHLPTSSMKKHLPKSDKKTARRTLSGMLDLDFVSRNKTVSTTSTAGDQSPTENRLLKSASDNKKSFQMDYIPGCTYRNVSPRQGNKSGKCKENETSRHSGEKQDSISVQQETLIFSSRQEAINKNKQLARSEGGSTHKHLPEYHTYRKMKIAKHSGNTTPHLRSGSKTAAVHSPKKLLDKLTKSPRRPGNYPHKNISKTIQKSSPIRPCVTPRKTDSRSATKSKKHKRSASLRQNLQPRNYFERVNSSSEEEELNEDTEVMTPGQELRRSGILRQNLPSKDYRNSPPEDPYDYI